MAEQNNKTSLGELENVYKHITCFSFGALVYEDFNLCGQLRAAILKMNEAIETRQITDISINMAYQICSRLVRENIGKLKKHNEKRLCFEVAFIMLFAFRPECREFVVSDVALFLSTYPEFAGLDEVQMKTLMDFRNVMNIAQRVIPPLHHKNHLLDLVTRIVEGRTVKYVTGSGQTFATSMRVLIYHRETGVEVLPRPPRKSEMVAAACSKGKAALPSKIVASVCRNRSNRQDELDRRRFGRVEVVLLESLAEPPLSVPWVSETVEVSLPDDYEDRDADFDLRSLRGLSEDVHDDFNQRGVSTPDSFFDNVDWD